MTVLTAHIALDAVQRLGRAGRPLSGRALTVLVALTDLAPNAHEAEPMRVDLKLLAGRCGSASTGPLDARTLRRLLNDLAHSGLIKMDTQRGRAPIVQITPDGGRFVKVPLPLLWPGRAHKAEPLRDGAHKAVVALLVILARSDWTTRTGRVDLTDLTAFRNAQTGLIPSVDEVKDSRAALEQLAGPAMTWTRPSNGRGRGPYRVAWDWRRLDLDGWSWSKTREPAEPPRIVAGPAPDEGINVADLFNPTTTFSPTHQTNVHTEEIA